MLGRRTFSVRAGRKKNIRMRLDRNGRQRIIKKKKKKTRAKLVITTRAADGTKTTTTKNVTISAPKERRTKRAAARRRRVDEAAPRPSGAARTRCRRLCGAGCGERRGKHVLGDVGLPRPDTGRRRALHRPGGHRAQGPVRLGAARRGHGRVGRRRGVVLAVPGRPRGAAAAQRFGRAVAGLLPLLLRRPHPAAARPQGEAAPVALARRRDRRAGRLERRGRARLPRDRRERRGRHRP